MAEQKVSRNDLCPCGSGKKFKKCCLLHGGPFVLRANNSQRTVPPAPPGFFNGGPQPSSPPLLDEDHRGVAVEDLGGTAGISDLPDPADVSSLPVEIGLDYTYPEPFGTAEVSYLLPAGRPYILANGEEILNDDLQPEMHILLKDGAIATITGVRHYYEPPDPPVRALDGRMLSRVVGRIKHKGFATVDVGWSGYTATSSPDHPYYSVSRGGYIPAQQLKVGEFLRTDDNLLTPVLSVSKPKFGMVDLYNVEVEDCHNYYVGKPGGSAVLVHNSANPGNYINTPEELSPSAQKAAKLKETFKGVDLPEIQGVDFSNMSHADIAKLLPSYGGKHPMKAILIDKQTGKAYGIASGWEAETITHNGMPFKAGALSPEVAAQAATVQGEAPWTSLGNHMEPTAAAFMRKMGITDAVVYINGRNPCWGTATAPGCFYRMPEFLAEGSKMTVYNKFGSDFIKSQPDRKFNFTGLPD